MSDTIIAPIYSNERDVVATPLQAKPADYGRWTIVWSDTEVINVSSGSVYREGGAR